MVRLLTEVQKMEETLVSVGRRRFVETGYGAGKGLGGSRLQIREVSTRVDKEHSLLRLEVHLGGVFRLLSYPRECSVYYAV